MVMDGPRQYLGYTDGDLVRDRRSGLAGRVRVRDDAIGRYAEVAWDGSFAPDELEVAIDNGLERDVDPADPTAPELAVDDVWLVVGPNPVELELVEPELTVAAVEIPERGSVTIEPLDSAPHMEGGPELKAHIVSVWGRAACTGEPVPSHAQEIQPTIDQKCPDCVAWEKDCDHQLVMQLQDELDATQSDGTVTVDELGAAPVELDEPDPVAEPNTPELEVQGESQQGSDPSLGIDDAELHVEPEAAEPGLVPAALTLEIPEPELAVDEQELDGPDSDDTPDDDTDQATQPADDLTEPTVVEPELEVTEPGPWETDLDTPGPEPSSPTSWFGTSKQWVRDRAGDVTSWAGDRAAKAKLWVDELRSGKHRQSFGQWEETGAFGCTKECTVQVGKNVLGMDLAEMNATFGANFIGQAVVRNDRERRSFDEQADFVEHTHLEGRSEPELEK